MTDYLRYPLGGPILGGIAVDMDAPYPSVIDSELYDIYIPAVSSTPTPWLRVPRPVPSSLVIPITAGSGVAPASFFDFSPAAEVIFPTRRPRSEITAPITAGTPVVPLLPDFAPRVPPAFPAPRRPSAIAAPIAPDVAAPAAAPLQTSALAPRAAPRAPTSSIAMPLTVPPPVGPALIPQATATPRVPPPTPPRPRLQIAAPITFAVIIVPPVGPAVAATLILQLESGTKLTYGWVTDVLKAWSGKEQRVSLLGAPTQRFDGVALLVDGDDRNVRAKLVTSAQSGAAFLLGLPYDELTITAPASGTTVSVSPTALALIDWALPGQRVLVIDLDDTVTQATVQSTSSGAIRLDVAPAARAGARIMPATAVYLDAQQGLGRHTVNLTEWHIAARAAEFGYAGSDVMGGGATITTWPDPTVGDRPVWDRRDMAADVLDESMHALSEIVDLGGVPKAVGSATAPDWGRQLAYSGSGLEELAWLRAFLAATRGRFGTFLLPTWRPDLVPLVATSAGQVLVASASTPGAGDPLAWLNHSPGHRRIMLVFPDGSWVIEYVTGWGDNLDGTVTLNVDNTYTGETFTMISWVEVVHWESDSLELTFAGSDFTFKALARVVQQ